LVPSTARISNATTQKMSRWSDKVDAKLPGAKGKAAAPSPPNMNQRRVSQSSVVSATATKQATRGKVSSKEAPNSDRPAGYRSSSTPRASFNGKVAQKHSDKRVGRRPSAGQALERPEPSKSQPTKVHAVAQKIMAKAIPLDATKTDGATTSFFSPSQSSVSSSKPASPTSPPAVLNQRAEAEALRANPEEVAALRAQFQARESELLQELADLRGALATARLAQAAAESSLLEIRGEEREKTGTSMEDDERRPTVRQMLAAEVIELKQQVLLLHQTVAKHERENQQQLEEQQCRARQMELQLARQEEQFQNECARIWEVMSGRRPQPAQMLTPASERPRDASANAVLRQVYAAVSELP